MSTELDDDDLAGIPCARNCGRIAPITKGELRGAGGDPSLLPVLEAWTPLAELDGMDGEPHEEQVAAVEFDPDQIVCPQCVLAHERDAWLDRLNDADDALRASVNEPTDAAGRAMLGLHRVIDDD